MRLVNRRLLRSTNPTTTPPPPSHPPPQLGFKTFVIPASSNVHASARLRGARIVECRTVVEAFRAVLGGGGGGGGA